MNSDDYCEANIRQDEIPQGVTQLSAEVNSSQYDKWKDNLPADLKTLPQWVVWKLKSQDGRVGKLPYNPNSYEQFARVNDSATWSNFNTATRTFVLHDFSGIGFVLTDNDPYTAIDLDHCRDLESGVIVDWARGTIDLMDSYTEVSPSGTGIRILVRGKAPANRKSGDREVYRGSKYVTLTGHSLNIRAEIEERQEVLNQWFSEAFAPVMEKSSEAAAVATGKSLNASDSQILEAAFHAQNGSRIQKLFDGELNGFALDRSRADMALCGGLAFYTGDAAQLERLMRGSALNRSKWDERRGDSTYLRGTVAKALANRTGSYTPPKAPNKSAADADTVELIKAEEPAFEPKKTPFLSVEDLNHLPKPKWLISDYLELDSLAVLYGASGIGKSFVALDWALTVASGEEGWLGYEAEKGRVLYIAAEGTKGLSYRIAAWKQAHPHCGDLENIHLLTSAIQFADRKAVQALLEDIQSLPTKPALIVVDTLARCLVGEDENSAKEVGLFIAGVDRLRQATGACMLTLHHTGKQGSAERGSSALRGAVDSMIYLKGSKGSLELLNDKQKDHAEAAALRLRLVSYLESCVVTRDNDSTSRSVSGKLNEKQQIIVDKFKESGKLSLTWKELFNLSGLTEKTFGRYLDSLVKNEDLIHEGRTYQLSQSHLLSTTINDGG